jgi:hypothetical protein
MNREEKIAAFLALGGAAVAGAAYWSSRDEEGGILETIADEITLATTTETARMTGLQPEVAAQLARLIAKLAAGGIDVFVGNTVRTKAQEKANVEAGKTSAGLKYSWHSLGRAVDLYPIDPATGKWDRNAKRLDLFQAMHAAAKSLGWRGLAFEADGVTKKYLTNSKGKKIWDGGHLEWRAPHATIAAAVAAEGPAYGIG